MKLKPMKLKLMAVAVFSSLILTGCGSSSDSIQTDTGSVTHDLTNLKKVLETNADIAFASYSDSVSTAEALKSAIDALAANPSQTTLDVAKTAWLIAREPYGQTEAYRFRNSPIDDNPDTAEAEDGPEGSLNAWPLGEALIDYVQASTTDFGNAEVGVTAHAVTGITSPIDAAHANANSADNIIGNTSITINAALLDNSATAADEHDVISGYHAIEFILWGQDLNNSGTETSGTDRDSAVKTHDASNLATGGKRPFTDFMLDATCTSGINTLAASSVICQRRHDYLLVAVDKLIDDLKFVRDHWQDGVADNYRDTFTNPANLTAAEKSFLEILTGMGTMSVGELAGERMQISLSANSQEDEHSCFSDNTHRDIWLNAEGVANMYTGTYAGYDSTLNGTADNTSRAVDGYGIDDYLVDLGGQTLLATSVSGAFALTKINYEAIDTKARAGFPVDVLIMDKNSDNAKPMRDAILSLNAQSIVIAKIATDLNVGSATDVNDPGATECDTTDPTAVCP